MFSREEKKQLNTSFFKRFQRQMGSHRITGGGGGRWEAYKTGVKGIYFRMLTFPEVAVAIDLQFKEEDVRELFFEQFQELSKLLENEWNETPVFYKKFILDSGVEVSRICVSKPDAYFYDKKQWDEIIAWYENKLVGLDSFWETVGDIIKELAR